jgi:FkbM family methyltransferase
MRQYFREFAKLLTNDALRLVDARVVSASWGPRGFAAALERAARAGLCLREIVDVGAASGTWTEECLRIAPDAKYFLVDPLEENRAALQRLAASHPNVHPWVGALGAHEEVRPLIVHGDQSSFYSSEYKTVGARTRSVAIRTLDSFLGQEILGPTLIKADVQGDELEVLRGAQKCLATTQLVLLEVSFRRIYAGAPLAHEVFAEMGSMGFRILDICTYAQRPRDHELAQSDVLFARADSRLFAYEGYE